MRVLVLWADNRSPNLGVRVLGAGTEALVRSAFPHAEVVHVSNGMDTAPMRVGDWRPVLKEAVTGKRGLVDWLSGFDLAVDTRAGDSFADIYGIKRLWTMNLLGELVRRARVPIILGPQTLGPFESPVGRVLARRTFRMADAVFARDSVSQRYGLDFGAKPELVSDVVFALEAPEEGPARDVVLNVSGLLWSQNPHVDAGLYRHTVRRLVNELTQRGRRVSLLAHVLDNPSLDNDVPALHELATSLPEETEVVVPGDLPELRSIVASAQLVIASRMHACLNALSCGTPAIALAYSRKFAPLMGDIGWSWSVDLRESPDPVAEVLAAVEAPGLSEAARATRERGRSMLGTAREILKGIGNASSL